MSAIMIKVIRNATGGSDVFPVDTNMTLKEIAEASWLGIEVAASTTYTLSGRSTCCGDHKLCDFGNYRNGTVLIVDEHVAG